MSSVFFCLTVSLLIPLFVRSNDPPPLPHTGKLSKSILTNYYIIQESNYMEDTIKHPTQITLWFLQIISLMVIKTMMD